MISMSEKKTIYCPYCGRRVAQYDGRSSTPVIANCRKCRLRVVFDVNTKETIAKKIPARACSSGMTFY